MESAHTRLEFEATIDGVAVKASKPAPSDYGQPKAGALEVKLTVEQPQLGKEPRKPDARYYSALMGEDGVPKPRPGDVARKAGESDEEYEARDAVVKRRAAQQQWDFQRSRYDAALDGWHKDHAAWEREAQAFRARTMAYAQLVGLAAVFGNQKLRVTLEPADTELLPGFSLSLLEPDAAVSPQPLAVGGGAVGHWPLAGGPDPVEALIPIDDYGEDKPVEDLIDDEDEE